MIRITVIQYMLHVLCLTCFFFHHCHSSFVELVSLQEKQKKLEALQEHRNQLKEAIDTIMKECTGDWIDKFDCDGAKSVPRCVLVLCCSACISA
jgi:cellobiose phosphorylase